MTGPIESRRRTLGERSIRYWLLVSGLLLTGGCASSSSGANPDGSGGATVQFTVLNESAVPITVYALWSTGRRTRLGNARGVSTETFTTELRATGVWFEIEDQSRMRTGRRQRPNSYIPIGRGDHLEVITGFGGAILSVRALPSL